MILNIFDDDFRHLAISVHGKNSKKVYYVRDNMVWDGVTVFTGHYIGSNLPYKVSSRYKFAWILECRELNEAPYLAVENNMEVFDKVLTHDETLLSRFPNKCIKVPFGGCWVSEDNYGVHKKTKNCSLIYSSKTFMKGHQLRHNVASKSYLPLDLFGNGSSNPINFKEEALKDYRFSVVIENSKTTNYFTEKLLDCFSLGTVPIYWGAPNIGDYFDTEGMIIVNSLEDLEEAVYNSNESSYENFLKGVNNNFELFKDYAITEDWMYENIYKDYD